MSVSVDCILQKTLCINYKCLKENLLKSNAEVLHNYLCFDNLYYMLKVELFYQIKLLLLLNILTICIF